MVSTAVPNRSEQDKRKYEEGLDHDVDFAEPASPHAAANYWAQVSQYLATIRNDLGRTLPEAPAGMRGMSEDAVSAMQEAFDEALLAADAAMGMSSRLANTTAGQQPGQPQQQSRPQRTQQPYAHAGW